MRTPQSHTTLENPPSKSTLQDLRMGRRGVAFSGLGFDQIEDVPPPV